MDCSKFCHPTQKTVDLHEWLIYSEFFVFFVFIGISCVFLDIHNGY